MVRVSARASGVLLLKVGLSAGALILLFRFVKPADVGRALSSAAPAGVAMALLLNVATRCAAAGRTYAVSRVANLPLTYARILQALFIANFWSLALPGVSAGSVATVLRYHGSGAGVMQSLAVLAVSRMVELLAFCLLALVGLSASMRAAGTSHLWVAALLLGVMAAVVVGFRLLGPLSRMSASVPERSGWLGRVRSAASASLTLLADLPRSALMRASGWALFQGVLDAATVLALAIALGIPIGLPEALWINALSYLVIFLPISAAGVGVREIAVLAALLPLGIHRGEALALALLMLAMMLVNALAGAMLQVFTRASSRQPAPALPE